MKDNGVLFKGCDFPVGFGPLGYLGVAASVDIPPNTTFAAIPSKLFISTTMVDKTELNIIIKENKEFFEKVNDVFTDLNKLTLWVMYERMKG